MYKTDMCVAHVHLPNRGFATLTLIDVCTKRVNKISYTKNITEYDRKYKLI